MNNIIVVWIYKQSYLQHCIAVFSATLTFGFMTDYLKKLPEEPIAIAAILSFCICGYITSLVLTNIFYEMWLGIKKLIIQKNKGLFRVSIFISFCWIVLSFIEIHPIYRYKKIISTKMDEFLLIGIFPVCFLWILAWVIRGFEKSPKSKNSGN